MGRENFEEPKPSRDRELSEPQQDSGFGYLLERMGDSDPSLAGILKDIDRSPDKKSILTFALIVRGHEWIDLWGLRDNPEAAAAFGQLISHWDTPIDGKPKTFEQHTQEAEEFSKLL